MNHAKTTTPTMAISPSNKPAASPQIADRPVAHHMKRVTSITMAPARTTAMITTTTCAITAIPAIEP